MHFWRWWHHGPDSNFTIANSLYWNNCVTNWYYLPKLFIQWTNSVQVRKSVSLFFALKQFFKLDFRHFPVSLMIAFMKVLIFFILLTWEGVIFSSFSENSRNWVLQPSCSGLSLNILSSASLRWSCCSQLVHSLKVIFLFRPTSGSIIDDKLTKDCLISFLSKHRGWLWKYVHNIP